VEEYFGNLSIKHEFGEYQCSDGVTLPRFYSGQKQGMCVVPDLSAPSLGLTQPGVTSRRTAEGPTVTVGAAIPPLHGLHRDNSDFFRRNLCLNTLRTGDADLRFYITTVQDV
jgi:hypothetical protein